MHDIKDVETLIKKVQFVLQNVDQERYLDFRSGKLSLAQCIARVEGVNQSKSKYKVLDDVKHDLDP